MFSTLQRVALRQNAIFIPDEIRNLPAAAELSAHTLYSLGELKKCGFSLTEKALRAFNRLTPEQQGEVMKNIDEAFALKMNWTPLVRDWQKPTGQTQEDMLYTYLYNLCDRAEGGSLPGTRLPCGHVIPDGVFALGRYTGCPFCGKPFEISSEVNYGQGSSLRVLDAMSEEGMAALLRNLLEMNTPLDATQTDTLRILLLCFPIPDDADIKIKETLVAVMDFMIMDGTPERLLGLVKSPADVLRYLWYKHTGHIRIIRPRTLLSQTLQAWHSFCPGMNASISRFADRKAALRLHFSRATGRIMAWLLNTMPMPAEEMCGVMHPHRNIWTHMIRALHLPDFARKKGNGKLRNVLDRFYRGDYLVVQGAVDKARLRDDVKAVTDLLKMRPGAFARQLFSNMLWFGPEPVIEAFRKVLPHLPTRLVISLTNSARQYFDPEARRVVTTVTGKSVEVEKPALLCSYTSAQLQDMVVMIKGLVTDTLSLKYGMMPKGDARHIYIDPVLDRCVLPIGDRSLGLRDTGSVLPGMSLPVEGDKVRLFLFWGEGLPAQDIDLDLSAMVFYDTKAEDCYFGNLTITGVQHSGDIRQIPDQVGTAEYVELDLPVLRAAGARYVVFSMASYSGGRVPPNTRVGWMSSEFPMTVDNETGVAFDPSCVQMMVRVPENMESRSMLFGVLDVEKREITYLESYEQLQVVDSQGASVLLALMEKMREKLTVGQALRLMARAQGLDEVSTGDLAADPDLPAKTLVFDSSCLSDIPRLLRTLIPD